MTIFFGSVIHSIDYSNHFFLCYFGNVNYFILLNNKLINIKFCFNNINVNHMMILLPNNSSYPM